ncbi:hypothetical protein GS398_08945 [Pedobacter sp. HMF7056]|uniref:Mannose-6-phosphate isomerase n=2 Tax=Hufsiella ginkgonis TaxID=2695274 RepID=A0A7K1XX67_9SPHI|nr:hypothetical protein [Hufsiella ginkgonis]
MPMQATFPKDASGYDIYPLHTLGDGRITNGYANLAKWIMKYRQVAIDGYAGVFWDTVEQELSETFREHGLTVNWVRTGERMKPLETIRGLVQPFLGMPGTVWGTKCSLSLKDLYEAEPVDAEPGADLTVVIGPGASLFDAVSPLIYIDLPKNELQLRMRAGSVFNLGETVSEADGEMYKRFYFVDWVLLNAHKKDIMNRIAVMADGQWGGNINWCLTADLYPAMRKMAKHVFRVRPWFEPGAWGGHWMKDRIGSLSQEEVNYAWSFELIVPENGILFASSGLVLEISFDFLMFCCRNQVMGKHAERFGDAFPIRFDFLDTWKGGNLSIQCHPSLSYIQQEFGETITQDETYYILDCEDNAGVYLGFQDDIDPGSFRRELEESRDKKIPVDIEKYVQLHPAHKHDLFLIPNGTVHSAAAGNLVLEISATPYIFTFKMYDWLRLGLNGEPRAINIDHAFNNLRFERKGEKVKTELIAAPVLLRQSPEEKLWHLPTHADHFYDVYRAEFDKEFTASTNNGPQVLMVVEGTAVSLKNADGAQTRYHYAETFVVPAAAETFTLVNEGKERVKVVIAFLKEVGRGG